MCLSFLRNLDLGSEQNWPSLMFFDDHNKFKGSVVFDPSLMFFDDHEATVDLSNIDLTIEARRSTMKIASSTHRRRPALLLSTIFACASSVTEALATCALETSLGGQTHTMESSTKLSIVGFDASVKYISDPTGELLFLDNPTSNLYVGVKLPRVC